MAKLGCGCMQTAVALPEEFLLAAAPQRLAVELDNHLNGVAVGPNGLDVRRRNNLLDGILRPVGVHNAKWAGVSGAHGADVTAQWASRQ